MVKDSLDSCLVASDKLRNFSYKKKNIKISFETFYFFIGRSQFISYTIILQTPLSTVVLLVYRKAGLVMVGELQLSLTS